jgi:hypothetical protein
MNGLGSALIWSAIQITLVAPAALVIERWASRRGPRAGSWVASTSMWLVIVVSPLPFCQPLFGWTCRSSSTYRSAAFALNAFALRPLPAQTAGEGDDHELSARNDSWSGLVVPFSWLRGIRDSLARQAETIRQGRYRWARTWVFLLPSGTAWCLLRVVMGLWGVRECRLRSVPVDDSELLGQVESLRVALGLLGRVEVRELPQLVTTTAAAVGWWQPLVLLPGNWRTWNESERRAVLAHELAHVARADYAAGIVARLGLALHFYHPLVHWMVARLRLQQELAADAQGARLAGGRRSYLVSLSRLALRQEGSLPAWPAKAFLPARGHLIRRIHVLKEKCPAKDGSLSTTARAITIASLLAVGIVATVLRGPSASQGAEPPPSSVKDVSKPFVGSAPNSNTKPFDVSFIPAKAQGFLAIRPATIFQLSGMKRHFETVDALIAKELPDVKLRIESIEQATLGLSVQPRDQKTGQPGRFMIGAGMVRTVEDFDWKSVLQVIARRFGPADAKLVEVRFEGQVYYRATYISPFGRGLCFYFPDARTVVHLEEEAIRHVIRGGAGTRPEYVQGGDWRKVERDMIAFAFNNKDQRWKLDVATDEPEDLPMAACIQNASRWVFGVDGADSLVLHAIATCATEQKGETVVRSVEALLSRMRAFVNPAKLNPPVGKQEAARTLLRLATDVLQACKVHRDGVVVDLSVKSQLPFENLMTVLLAEAGF